MLDLSIVLGFIAITASTPTQLLDMLYVVPLSLASLWLHVSSIHTSVGPVKFSECDTRHSLKELGSLIPIKEKVGLVTNPNAEHISTSSIEGGSHFNILVLRNFHGLSLAWGSDKIGS